MIYLLVNKNNDMVTKHKTLFSPILYKFKWNTLIEKFTTCLLINKIDDMVTKIKNI